MEAPVKEKRRFNRDDFKVGTIVWAKLKGHPWWPAKIMNEEDIEGLEDHGKGRYPIQFYGDGSVASVGGNMQELSLIETAFATRVKASRRNGELLLAMDELMVDVQDTALQEQWTEFKGSNRRKRESKTQSMKEIGEKRKRRKKDQGVSQVLIERDEEVKQRVDRLEGCILAEDWDKVGECLAEMVLLQFSLDTMEKHQLGRPIRGLLSHEVDVVRQRARLVMCYLLGQFQRQQPAK